MQLKVLVSCVRNVSSVWLQEDSSQDTKLNRMDWGGEEVSEAWDITMEISWKKGP